MNSNDLLDDLRRCYKARLPKAEPAPSLAALGILRLAGHIQRRQQRAFDSFGIHPSGFEVLVTLWRLDEPRGISMAQLATILAVTPASMTNRIDNLIAKGWVERNVSEVDKRIAYAKLTKDGYKLVDKLLPEQFALEATLFDGLKKGDRKDFFKFVVKALGALEKDDPEAITA